MRGPCGRWSLRGDHRPGGGANPSDGVRGLRDDAGGEAVERREQAPQLHTPPGLHGGPVGGLVEGMSRVPAHPAQLDGTTGQLPDDGAQEPARRSALGRAAAQRGLLAAPELGEQREGRRQSVRTTNPRSGGWASIAAWIAASSATSGLLVFTASKA